MLSGHRRKGFLFQLLGLIVRGERIDNRIEGAVHHLIELMNRQADAVIADAILFEVVSANFF